MQLSAAFYSATAQRTYSIYQVKSTLKAKLGQSKYESKTLGDLNSI